MSQNETPEMRRMIKEFSGDYRIMRVVLATSDPIQTLHRIRTKQYSIHTFLDMLEMLDAKATMEEQSMVKMKVQNNGK